MEPERNALPISPLNFSSALKSVRGAFGRFKMLFNRQRTKQSCNVQAYSATPKEEEMSAPSLNEEIIQESQTKDFVLPVIPPISTESFLESKKVHRER